MYAKIVNSVVVQYPFHIQTLKQENPNTSFPSNIETDYDSLKEYNVFRVFESSVPVYNAVLERTEEGPPMYNGDRDRWEQSWVVQQLSGDELQLSIDAYKNQIVALVQQRLDNFAKTRNYDSILSAATYATSAVPKFAAEGQYAITARDQTWAALYQILADVQAGTRPMPASYEDIEGELPNLVWPEPV